MSRKYQVQQILVFLNEEWIRHALFDIEIFVELIIAQNKQTKMSRDNLVESSKDVMSVHHSLLTLFLIAPFYFYNILESNTQHASVYG